ncbi:hypothetical protein [Streptomyces mirabilis]|uniref:hypothetical protein n=1 Tax=Streptomyces mirabilis TaxID=68239 RepID=UPI0033AB8E58
MTLERTLREPVQLTDPLAYAEPYPEPTPECDICEALVSQRKSALNPESSDYDLSRASDLLVELQRHQDEPGRKRTRQ